MGTQALDAARLFDLTGRTAVVTGASSGLGVTFAQTLAANGASLVLAARRRERLDAVAAGLPGSGEALVVECDITQPAQIEAMCDAAIDRFGALDILVANAGVIAEGVPAPERTPPDSFAMGVEVNISGTFNTVTAAARRMLAAGGGSIIITASVGGISGHRGLPSAYCASKAAQIQMAKHLGATWADRGVRVNAIAPAWFPSEMTDGFLAIPAWLARCEEQTPLGRIGAPHELAGPLLLLASDAGSYITGSVLVVDGGYSSTTGSSPYSAEVTGILGGIMPEGLSQPIVPA